MSISDVQRDYQKKLENGTLQGLAGDHAFSFSCPDTCMGNCCQNIEIFLDPWDVETLSRHLGITGREFINEYGIYELGTEWRWPFVQFRHAAGGPCAFLLSDGRCRVYPARPRNCRAYPLGRAVRFESGNPPPIEERLFLMHRMAGCLGHEAERQWTVEEWLADADLHRYHQLSDLYLELINYAATALRSREWMHAGLAQMISPFLYAPEMLRARLQIPEAELDHEEFYRRRMRALRHLLTEVAGGLGYGPQADAAGSTPAAGTSLMDCLSPLLKTGQE